jgi:cephalosporin hydroxylase
MSFDRDQFEKDRLKYADSLANDSGLQKLAIDLITKSDVHHHAYQWNWLGMPIIQATEDIVAAQELVWKVQPDVIIETGIAWGGSMVFYASMLQLIGKGKIIGVDVVVPQKNIDAIMKYPFSNRIELIEGSSIDQKIVDKVKSRIKPGDKVMLMLDSNHTHEHVLEELKLYAPLVTKDSYIIVSDTVVEDIPEQTHRQRPWGKGDNPRTAVDAYLKTTDRFELDKYYYNKLLITFDRGGYIKCVKE